MAMAVSGSACCALSMRHGYRDALQVVAINELSDLETIAYLTRYDTTHGRFRGEVATRGRPPGGQWRCSSGCCVMAIPRSCPGRELEVDLVLECTGAFSDRASAGAAPGGRRRPRAVLATGGSRTWTGPLSSGSMNTV